MQRFIHEQKLNDVIPYQQVMKKNIWYYIQHYTGRKLKVVVFDRCYSYTF